MMPKEMLAHTYSKSTKIEGQKRALKRMNKMHEEPDADEKGGPSDKDKDDKKVNLPAFLKGKR